MPRLIHFSAVGECKALAARMAIGDTYTARSRRAAESLRSALRSLGLVASLRKTPTGVVVTRTATARPHGVVKQQICALQPGEWIAVPTRSRANTLRTMAWAYGISLRMERTADGLRMVRHQHPPQRRAA